MKKLAILSFILVASTTLYAQTLFDALRYSSTDILGTARYMSLAGSMGAIGGDPTAILDNPAGLGIYRSFEISASVDPVIHRANMEGVNDQRFHFNFNQGSFVFSIPSGRETGYVSSNFSLTYNRLKDFNRAVSFAGEGCSSIANMLATVTDGLHANSLNFDNLDAPFLSVLGYEGYMIDPVYPDSLAYTPYRENATQTKYRGIEKGRVEEYTFAYAANVGHFLYIGASLGLQVLDYKFISEIGESYENGAIADLKSSLHTSGVGCSFRFGVIGRPTSFLRLGASFQTPVVYSMKDYINTYQGEIITDGIAPDGRKEVATDVNSSAYKLVTPFKFQASVAFVIGKSAFINVDYQLSHNKDLKFKSTVVESSIFAPAEYQFENDELQRYVQDSHLIKVGAEYRIKQAFSLRAGVAYRTPATKNDVTKSMLGNTVRTDTEYFVDNGSVYGSFGIGYRYNGFGIDLTYAYNHDMQHFALYQEGLAYNENNGYFTSTSCDGRTKLTSAHHNIALTLLYKF